MPLTLLPSDAVTAPSSVHPAPRQVSPLRSFFQAGILGIILLLLLYTFFIECFYVPSGSMAPTLLGEHRRCTCSGCGNMVLIGKHEADRGDGREASLYRKAFCPWCGVDSISVASEPLRAGDRVMIDKLSYLWRRPRRWELAIFHLWGEDIIKRILGLPGEEILIIDGDVYCNGVLLRKSWDEIKTLHVQLFGQDRPSLRGGAFCWEEESPGSLDNASVLRLDGTNGTAVRTYRNFSPTMGKCTPLTDEQAYNGSLHPSWENVHDFLVEVDVTVKEGSGTFAVSLFDGADEATFCLPVGISGDGIVSCRPMLSKNEAEVLRTAPVEHLDRTFRLQMAFVDRRIQVRIDGQDWGTPIDLPNRARRSGVTHPFRLEAKGAVVECRQVRLYRDIHYTQAGNNGVRGQPVRLGAGEYFVLGDNSGRSEDSRFWPERGAIPEEALIGPALIKFGP